MSGILDRKSRVFDVIMTLEGRRQISEGRAKVVYYSFTDAESTYDSDIVSGSVDPANKIMLEACSLPQDQITLESDDAGRLNPIRSKGFSANVVGERIVTYSFNSISSSLHSGSNYEVTSESGQIFASLVNDLMKTSLTNLKSNVIIGTKDPLFEDEQFATNLSTINFVITDTSPIVDQYSKIIDPRYSESLFFDPRLRRLPNFKFLPPVNKPINGTTIDQRGDSLGAWKPLTQVADNIPINSIEDELKFYDAKGLSSQVNFDPTSLANNLAFQIFEVKNDSIKKLDVIDYGEYTYGSDVRHAFFVGKIVVDDNNTHTFIHLFTIVFGTFRS